MFLQNSDNNLIFTKLSYYMCYNLITNVDIRDIIQMLCVYYNTKRINVLVMFYHYNEFIDVIDLLSFEDIIFGAHISWLSKSRAQKHTAY